MIDFAKELQAILENDPLGILKTKAKTSSVISADNRLKASFEEINQFIDTNGHEPRKSREIHERKLFSRLENLKQSPEKAAMLLDLDKHNLLDDVEVPEPLIIETIDDVLDADPLGLLSLCDDGDNGNKESDIFDLTNLPSQPRALTDFVAKRKPCKDFVNYEAQFIQVQSELKNNKRKLTHFTDKGEALVQGNYYILGGILLYLESIYISSPEKTIEGKRFRKDGRTRCIFENGTESNMLYRSLAKSLYQGGKIVSQTEDHINKLLQENLGTNDGINKEEDELTGTIYILKSLSNNVEIQSLQNLYKVGFSTTSVEKRIANAENEPTYLMSPVKIVAEYEAYNINTQKFENLLHRFLADVCLDLKVADSKGRLHQPREWFIAPIDVINRAIELIVTRQIQHYRYDDALKSIVAV
ncbi:MAG: GIY-YIG nuclease family protein [Gammaproteobacteria bacterium]|nr:GIY-YIG nuclease family protein [Gammaproteobacteria bacterium]